MDKIIEYLTTDEYASITGAQDRDFIIEWIDINTETPILIRDSLMSIDVSYSMDMCPQISIQLFDPEFRMLRSNYFNIGQSIIYKSSTPAQYTNFGDKPPVNPSGKSQDHPFDMSSLDGSPSIGWISQIYEIASVSVSPGSGSAPSIIIEARTAAVQQMKRDKEPSSVKGDGHTYVSQAAQKYDLISFVQQTSKSKQINKGGTDKQADSLWTVLNNLAGDAKFSLFEANGTLFFASNQYIFGLWGPEHIANAFVFNPETNYFDLKSMNFWYVNWPIIPEGWYPTQSSADFRESYQSILPGTLPGSPIWKFGRGGDVYTNVKNPRALIPLAMPTFRRSDNDIYQVEGTISLDRSNGIFLRPGMTIYVDGIPTFNDYYLITDVSYSHMSTDPVQITFRKPEREAKYIVQIPIGPVASTNVSR